MCFCVEEMLKLVGVSEIAVMGEDDAVGTIDVEGLRLGVCRGSSGRISD